MKIAAVHMQSIYGDVYKNFMEISRIVKELAVQNVQFALFPELSLSGYIKDVDLLNRIMTLWPELSQRLKVLSHEANVSFALGFPEKQGDDYYISHHLFSQGDIIGSHKKTHLGPTEQSTFIPASQIHCYDLGKLRVGFQLCFETHMPEISFSQAEKGANLLCMAFASPGETSEVKLERFLRYLPARAYDNSSFLMACNMEATSPLGKKMPGLGLIIDPKGKIIAQSLSNKKEYCIADIDLSQIERIRSTKMGWFNQHKRQEIMRRIYGG